MIDPTPLRAPHARHRWPAPDWQSPEGRIRIYRGDALEVLAALPESSCAAVIADPPYSSGGLTRGDRTLAPAKKYISSGTAVTRPGFGGDARDQRGYLAWSTLWLSRALRLVRESGYLLTFTDWRQLPVTSDAVQCGGWVWRGIVAWDKGLSARAPHRGYSRHQCEYVVWGTRGVSRSADHGGPWPGCVRCKVDQRDKHHMVGKPTALLEQLVSWAAPGAVVLDPFAGSGTTGVACALQQRACVLIEAEPHYFRVAVERVAEALDSRASDRPSRRPRRPAVAG